MRSLSIPQDRWFLNGRVSCALLVAILLSSGCADSTPDSGEVIDESWFTTSEDSSDNQLANDAPADPNEARAELAINLKPGDRFPLQKTVEKTLTQNTIQGPLESKENIDLFMSITVEEIRDQNKRFGVRYNRVQYTSTINGQTMTYDSRNPPYPVPDNVLVYHGMINNGFSFWVGPDNKITDVVDFNEFMKKCLAMVPSHKAQVVSEILAQYSGQDGIANFVDDTIGLLPYDSSSPDGGTIVRLGGHWSKSRNYNDPVPMSLHNTYTLREINPSYAKVEILGKVSPAVAVSGASQDSVQLQIRDGHSAGTCTIDRKTGLPLESRIDHLINMTVQAEGVNFDQQKRVITSIRMFPEQSGQDVYRLTAENEDAPAPSHNETPVMPTGYESQKTIR